MHQQTKQTQNYQNKARASATISTYLKLHQLLLSFFFTLVHKNDMFSFLEIVSLKNKNRYPTPYGSRLRFKNALRATFMDVLLVFLKWFFLKMTPFLHTILGPKEMSRLGYSWAFINAQMFSYKLIIFSDAIH